MGPASRDPILGVDRRGSHGPMANQFLSSSARPQGRAGPKMGHLGPRPGAGAGWSGAALSGSRRGSCPSQSPASAVSPRALLSACPQVTWSLLNLQEACGTSPEPRALIYVLPLWGVFSKNRMDVRKTTTPQNHT